jgi:hypothetical protein
MPQGTQRPPIREEDRIKALERQVKSLERTVANLLKAKPRTHWHQVRLARTIDDGDYLGSGFRHPIVFVDAAWDEANEDTDLTDKSESVQAYALSAESMAPGIGGLLFVEQTEKGQWLVLDAAVGSVRIAETDGSGIGAGGTATVTELDTTGADLLDDASDPITYSATNVFTGAIGANRRILTVPWKHDASVEIIIAEDCPA